MIEKLPLVDGIRVFVDQFQEGEHDAVHEFVRRRGTELTLEELSQDELLSAFEDITPYGWRYFLPWFVEALDAAPPICRFGEVAMKVYVICSWMPDRAADNIFDAVHRVADEIRKDVRIAIVEYMERCEVLYEIASPYLEFEQFDIEVENTLRMWDPK